MIQAPPPAQIAPPAEAHQSRASVLRVRAEDGVGGRGRSGSGVVVAPGIVATSAHVIDGAASVTLSQGDRRWTARPLRLDRDHDVALLVVTALGLPAAALAGEEGPVEGQRVQALGHPGGGALQATEGTLLAIWHFRGAPLYQCDAPVGPGSSGGGLFDVKGRLLGLTTFVFSQSPRLSFAVPVRWVKALVGGGTPAAGRGDYLAGFVAAMAEEPANWPAWERFCRLWVKGSPEDPDAWLALGHALDRTWREAKAQAPDAPDALHLESIAAYQRALSLRGGHAKAWNNLGAALDADNRFAEAEAAYREALRLQPDYGTAWINLGNLLLNTRRFEAAIPAYRRGLELEPGEGSAWARLGYCAYRSLRWSEAAEAYRVALRYLPFRRELWTELAEALDHLGDRAGAEEARGRGGLRGRGR